MSERPLMAEAQDESSEWVDPHAEPDLPAAPAGPPWWQKLLTAETGPGPIEAYRDHPLNWNGSSAVAQLLRGLTGLVGELRYAIVDIVLGGWRLLQQTVRQVGRPEQPAEPASSAGGDGPVTAPADDTPPYLGRT